MSNQTTRGVLSRALLALFAGTCVFFAAPEGAAANVAPVFAEGSSTARSLPENPVRGTDIGSVLAASDRDPGATLVWSLEGPDAIAFDIVPTSGQLRTKGWIAYDHEHKVNYSVVVRVEDGQGGSATIAVAVTVTDVAEPPGAPWGLTFVTSSQTSLEVDWWSDRHPGDRPSIASYDVRYRRAGAGESFTAGPQDVRDSRATIRDLAAETAYEVQVRATNVEGDSPWSESGFGSTGVAERAPGAPRNLELRPGDGIISVYWDAPADQGEPVLDGHLIQHRRDGTTAWTTVTHRFVHHPRFGSRNTSLHIQDLENGQLYQVRVAAKNTNGLGPYTEAQSATPAGPPTPLPPRAPSGLRASARGPTAIALSWRTTLRQASRAWVEHFRVEVSPSGTGDWTELATVPDHSHVAGFVPGYEHVGLTGGTTRYYRVFAVSPWWGASPASRIASATTGPLGPPVPPSAASAIADGQTAIEVSWQAPAPDAESRAAVSGYRVEWSADRFPPWTGIELSAAATRYRHDGLTGGTTRYYRVFALSAAGDSAASGMALATTESLAPPLAPSGVSAIADGRSAIEVSWQAPAPDAQRRAAVSGYRVEWSADGSAPWTGIDAVVTATRYRHDGLTGGIARYYRVFALSARGDGAASNVASATTAPPETGTAVAESPIAGFTLVDGAGGADLFALADGQEIAADLGKLEIRANLKNGERVGSVHFELSGPVRRSHIENFAPYELYGGRGGAALAAGSYTVKATPYTAPGLGGERLPAVTASFTVEAGIQPAAVVPAVVGLPHVSGPASGGTYAAGERIMAVVSFDAPITLDRTTGAPTLGLALGGVRRDAAWAGSLGTATRTATLRFALTVAAEDAGAGPAKAVANGIRLNGATIRSGDGTDALLAFGTAPGVTGGPGIVDAPGGDGRWSPDETLEVIVTFAEPVVVSGTPSVEVNLGSGAEPRRAAYAGGSGTSTLVFAYRLADGDGETYTVSVKGSSLALEGGSILSTGGLDAILEHPGAVLVLMPPPALPAFSVADAEASEGAELGFRVTLSEAAAGPVSVGYATADGVAVAGEDYEAASGTLYFASGETEKSVVVAALADDAEESAETLTLRLSSPSGATLGRAEATGTIADEAPPVGPAALTAQLLDVPPEHDGSSRFTFELRFSEEPAELSFRTVRDSLLAVTGGTVKRAKRVTRGSNLAFRIHIDPAGLGAVMAALRPPPACGVSGSVCTADGRRLTGTASATIPGPASLSVADAEAREGPGAQLEFTVTLSRARHEATRVDYATGDGTARAGEDYTATSGTLAFAAGETEKTVPVALLDDAHDDDGETLTLRLSNPEPAGLVRLGDATATGTIRNEGPLQKAWLARFGRTVAGQVVDAVDARLEAGAQAPAHLTLAGARIELGAGAERSAYAGWEWRAKPAAMSDVLRDGPESHPRTHAVAGRELLAGSAFHLPLNAAGDGPGAPSWTLWGRGAITGFEGREDSLTLDGEVQSGMFGADWSHRALSLGLLVLHSMGEGEYRRQVSGTEGADSGDLESTLTGVYPYGRWEANDRLLLWGVAGYGEGEFAMTGKSGERYEADMDLAMGAVGARAVVIEPGAGGGFELAVKPDAMAVRTTSEKTRGSEGGLMSAAEADVTLLRLGLEGTWRGPGHLVPSAEVALRHDGGDAESGLGLEVGGALRYADPSSGLSAELAGRVLVAHADDDYREWGFAGALVLDPGSDGLGMSFALKPSWGADAYAAERLLPGDPLANLAANDNDARGRLETELGYGLGALGGAGVLTPFGGLSLSEDSRGYRLGGRLEMRSFDLSLEGKRRETADDDAAEHGLVLRGKLRF